VAAPPVAAVPPRFPKWVNAKGVLNVPAGGFAGLQAGECARFIGATDLSRLSLGACIPLRGTMGPDELLGDVCEGIEANMDARGDDAVTRIKAVFLNDNGIRSAVAVCWCDCVFFVLCACARRNVCVPAATCSLWWPSSSIPTARSSC
jgi:hypothetical protein